MSFKDETQIFIQWIWILELERITEHSSIDTSPFLTDGKFIAFNSDRSAFNKYMLREVM